MVTSEILLIAWTAAVLGWIAAILLLIPQIGAHVFITSVDQVRECFAEPMILLAPCFSSVFGLRQWDGAENQGNKPAWFDCLMRFSRYTIIIIWFWWTKPHAFP